MRGRGAPGSYCRRHVTPQGPGRGIRPSESNGNGYKTSVSVRQDVLREGAQVKVVSCLQDGVGGSPYNCGIAYGGGNSAY